MNVSTPAVCAFSSLLPPSPRTPPLWRMISGIAAAILAATLSIGATAQTTTATRVTGSYSGTLGGGTSVVAQFSCTGTPTCSG